MSVAGETPDATPEPPCRRIVLAAITIDDEAIEAFAPSGDASAALPDPDGLASMPMLFRSEAPWWSAVASIGTGTPPPSHGVLTALAFDVNGRGAHPRRESDSDRPWVWSRFDRAGRGAVVCGWPVLQDLREAGVPAATAAGVLSPRRLLAAARAAGSDEAARDHLSMVVRPVMAAQSLPQAIRQAVGDTAADGPHSSTLRIVEATCAAARELERWSLRHSSRRPGPSLRCLGLQLLSTPSGTEDRSGDAESKSPETIENAADDAAPDAARRVHGDRLAAVLDRLVREIGPDDVLLVAVVGHRRGRLFHRGLANVPGAGSTAAAIDLVPTALDAAGLEVPADLPGRVIGRSSTEMERSWDLSGWNAEKAGAVESDAIVPVAERIERARKVLRDFAAPSQPLEDSLVRLRTMLLRHLDIQWALAMTVADWTAALEVTEGLVEHRGDAIDLWRRAFGAERAGERDIVTKAIAALRRNHPDDLATAIAALLEPGPPSRELVESIDLADVAIPTQRSVVGRAAAQLGLVEIARRALGPLIVGDLAIPEDRLAIVRILLAAGDGPRALAALGHLGVGPQSPSRLRILRAKCLAAADRREQALALLDRLLIETPFDTEARTLRERIASGE
jgi:hypothetical protein